MSSSVAALLLYLCASAVAIQPVARISLHSKAVGVYMQADNGRTFRAFRGIPYAKPPTGERRFKPPEESEGWKGLLNASRPPPCCLQSHFTKGQHIIGEEDCLYLNVYTPLLSRKRRSLYPVIVFVGGESFSSDDSDVYDPTRFLRQNIVFVTFNYRLGALGFLSTADNTSWGNYGLLDQVMALQWVKHNVGAFGGDSDRITLIGQGAGAVSSVLHMLSPLTKDLFQTVIIQNGSPLCLQWPSDSGLSLSTQIADEFNCSSNSSQELIKCLQKIDAKKLVSFPFLSWGPVIDKLHYIVKNPEYLLENGLFHSVPVILGVSHTYNKHNPKPMLVSPELVTQMENLTVEETARILVEYLLLSKFNFNDEIQVESLLESVMDEYFYNVNVSDPKELEQTLQWILSDIELNPCMVKTAELLSSHAPTRFYSFEYINKHPFQTNNQSYLFKDLSAEMLYLFHFKNVSGELKGDDREISNILLFLWTNFANYRNPTPSLADIGINWEVMTQNYFPYLKIDKPLSIEKDFRQEKISFWIEAESSLLQDNVEKRKLFG